MAPVDVAGAFQQRLRWSMGALQILLRRNPLFKVGQLAGRWGHMWGELDVGCLHVMGLGIAPSWPKPAAPPAQCTQRSFLSPSLCASQRGLTAAEALVFFESAIYPTLSVCTVITSLLPIVFLFTNVRLIGTQRALAAAFHCPVLLHYGHESSNCTGRLAA